MFIRYQEVGVLSTPLEICHDIEFNSLKTTIKLLLWKKIDYGDTIEIMKNSILPTIKINAWKLDEEVELFMNFLNSKGFYKRKLILKALPSLESKIKEQENEQEAVRLFLMGFWKKNRELIENIIEQDSELLSLKSSNALEKLSDYMDYRWFSDKTYIGQPTLLPFSPYKNETFYFSILGTITGNEHHNILATSIHEISHFIFFDILENIKIKNNIKLNTASKHYLKEAITTILINEPGLKRVLNITEYNGNPELQNLFIKWPGYEKMLLVDILKKLYKKSKQQKTPFNEFILKTLKIIHKNEEEFKKKMELWNQYGKDVTINPELKNLYSKKIVIKN